MSWGSTDQSAQIWHHFIRESSLTLLFSCCFVTNCRTPQLYTVLLWWCGLWVLWCTFVVSFRVLSSLSTACCQVVCAWNLWMVHVLQKTQLLSLRDRLVRQWFLQRIGGCVCVCEVVGKKYHANSMKKNQQTTNGSNTPSQLPSIWYILEDVFIPHIIPNLLRMPTLWNIRRSLKQFWHSQINFVNKIEWSYSGIIPVAIEGVVISANSNGLSSKKKPYFSLLAEGGGSFFTKNLWVAV